MDIRVLQFFSEIQDDLTRLRLPYFENPKVGGPVSFMTVSGYFRSAAARFSRSSSNSSHLISLSARPNACATESASKR